MCGAGQWVRLWSAVCCGGRKDTEGSAARWRRQGASGLDQMDHHLVVGVLQAEVVHVVEQRARQVGAIVVPVARTHAKPQPVHIRGQDNVV